MTDRTGRGPDARRRGWRGGRPAVVLGVVAGLGGVIAARGVGAAYDPALALVPLLGAVAVAGLAGGLHGGIAATFVGALGGAASAVPLAGRTELAALAPFGLIGLGLFIVAGLALGVVGELGLARTTDRRVGGRPERRPAVPEGGEADARHASFRRILERLAAATTASQVGDVLFTDALATSGADVAAMAILTPDGRRVSCLGWTDRWTDGGSEIGLDEIGGLADVVLLGRTLWLDGATETAEAAGNAAAGAAAAGQAAPGAAGNAAAGAAQSAAHARMPFAEPADGLAAAAVVPLHGRQAVIGALAFGWSAAHTLDAAEREFVASLGRHFGSALERAVALAIEQTLRRDTDTARLEALALRDALAAVVQSIREPVLVVEPTGAISLRNRAAGELLAGVATVDALAARLEPLRDEPIDLSAGRRGLARVADDERIFDVSVVAAEGGGGSRVVTLRDVTDERRALEAKDAFIGVLSHELRTPVTTVLGGIELLRRGLPSPVAAEVLEDVASETERLRRLIEDLLILSRFERDALEIGSEPVLVQRLLGPLTEAEAARHDPPATIRLAMPADIPPVAADPTYLDQIVRNLVSNAVKYGADAGPIDVTLAHADERVRIVVADRGPGFPAEDAERLFELFYRGSATAMKPGAGIGLFVARQLARGMGAELSGGSRAGGGAAFTLTLNAVTADWDMSEADAPEAGGAEAEPLGEELRR